MEVIEDLEGITATHPEYDAARDGVTTCRDCVAGARAIKAKTTTYFPALGGEVPRSDPNRLLTAAERKSPLAGQYEKRLMLAAVYEATDKTMDALLGALFRVPTTPTVPEAITLHLANIDLAGTSYDAFKQQAGAEQLEVARYGVLVDWSKEQNRPFWRPYEHEQIDNWTYGIRGGQKVLVWLKLKESVTERSSSGFGSDTTDRYRILELNAGGQVEVTTYTKRQRADEKTGKTKTVWEKEGPFPVARQGVALTEIPFVCFGRLDLDLCPTKPPLLSIADLQLDHYRLDGDIKWAIHVGCMGMLFVIGDGDADDAKDYYFGGAPNRLTAGASAEFLTSPSDKIDSARQEKADDERRMALMGARMLLAPKREAETAEASMIQRDGESASLSMISYALSTALTKCLQFHATWMGLPTEGVGDELSRDFFPHRLTPDEVRVQLQSYAEGATSLETLMENLYTGGINREPDTERERMAEEGPRAKPGDGDGLMEDETPAEDAA